MLISAEQVTARANELYRNRKAAKHPFRAPELLPQEIASDQVKATIEALVEAMNRELMNPIVVKVDESDDYDPRTNEV